MTYSGAIENCVSDLKGDHADWMRLDVPTTDGQPNDERDEALAGGTPVAPPVEGVEGEQTSNDTEAEVVDAEAIEPDAEVPTDEPEEQP